MHFCVAVFTKHPDQVDEALAPFGETSDPFFEYGMEFEKDEDCDYDEVAEAHGYWYNPRAQWDWYEIGGRWPNMLRLIDPNEDGANGNSARAANVEFNYDDERLEKAARFWDVVVDGKPARPDEDFGFHWSADWHKRMYHTKEDYVKCASSFLPHSFVTVAGNWICSEGYNKQIDFKKTFDAFVKHAKQNDLYITIVDCHS